MVKTTNATVHFGKWNGQLLTRVPVGYLQWAITQRIDHSQPLPDSRPVPVSIPFHEAAALELERRGERIHEIEISAHAVDRMSQVGLDVWERHRAPAVPGKAHEGVYSFLERCVDSICRLDANVGHAMNEAAVTGKPEQVKTGYLGLEWVIQVNLALPVLLTVTPGRQA